MSAPAAQHPAAPSPRPALRLAPPTRGPGEPAGGRPGGRAGHAPATPRHPERSGGPAEATLGRLARGFAALFLEVEAGHRPRGHLEALMTPLLYARLAPVWVRAGQVGRVVALRWTWAADEAFEAVAVVRRGRRYGALGLRLVRTGRGWRVDDVARPEDGPLPPPPVPPPPDEPDSFELVQPSAPSTGPAACWSGDWPRPCGCG